MTTLPIAPVTLPKDLVGVPNGQLPDALLVPVSPNPRWRMHHLAARAWEAMRATAWRAGIQLSLSGDPYRSLAQQTSLFLARYTDTYDPAVNTLDQQRTWNGKRWYKRLGVAPVASPGTSNHGLGLAVDTAIDADGDLEFEWPPKSVTPAAVDWLVANASRWGFSAELQQEPWHWRYTAGDNVPWAVITYDSVVAMRTIAPAAPIRLGTTGPEVRKLQEQCKRFGWYPYNIDGSCGPRTVDAIMKLQAAAKVTVDGYYGPVTQGAYQRWLDAR